MAVWGIASGVLMVCLFCGWEEGREAVRQLLIPGDAAVTVGAVEELTANLRQGSGLREALQCFCIRVLDGAGIGTG